MTYPFASKVFNRTSQRFLCLLKEVCSSFVFLLLMKQKMVKKYRKWESKMGWMDGWVGCMGKDGLRWMDGLDGWVDGLGWMDGL